jgi:flagellar biosynthesis/type III secretory pathway chaperone
MALVREYITILIESLNKKSKILTTILGKNALQEKAIKDEDTATFERVVEEKAVLLQELINLDNGFETVYERIKEELGNNKSFYSLEILKMQQLIREITDKSIGIQSSEQRNKLLIEKHFKDSRQSLSNKRTSVKVASNYYKNMSQLAMPESSRIDKKK